MRENRSYGLEGGESGSTGLPYPYRAKGGYGLFVAIRCQAVVRREEGLHRLATGGCGSRMIS